MTIDSALQQRIFNKFNDHGLLAEFILDDSMDDTTICRNFKFRVGVDIFQVQVFVNENRDDNSALIRRIDWSLVRD